MSVFVREVVCLSIVAFNKVTDEWAPFKNLNEDAYQKNKMFFFGECVVNVIY